jgi:tellurite resistance protein
MRKHSFSERLKHFSISFFAIILGLVGFALASQKAEELFAVPHAITLGLLCFSIAAFLIVTLIYLTKTLVHFTEVKKEFTHPIKLNFFPLIAKILLILSVIYLSIDMGMSRWLWIIGSALQFIFTITILSAWMNHSRFEIKHINPAWFIPIVGSVIVPIAGVQHAPPEISWFFFSGGLIWWLILFVIVINRVIFHHPVPGKLLPTFFILFAPPAIAFISTVKLLGELTPFGIILYNISLFMFILILFQFNRFRKIKFYLSWWAYSFPTVAITVATILMYHLTEKPLFSFIAGVMLLFLSLIIVFLLVRTAQAIRKQELCVPEED